MNLHTEKNNKNTKVYLHLFLLLLSIMVSVPLFASYVFADTTLLTQTERTVYVGDQFDLNDYFVEETELEQIKYEVLQNEEASSCIKVDETGVVSVLEKGTAVISITYKVKEQMTESTEQYTIHAVDKEMKQVVYGEMIPYDQLEAAGWYDMEQYNYRVSYNSLRIDEKEQCFVVQGFKEATVYMQKKDAVSPEFAVASFQCIMPEFEKDCYIRAIAASAVQPELLGFTLPLEDNSSYETDFDIISKTNVVWRSKDAGIVSYGENGFQPLAAGTTEIYSDITAINGDTVSLSAVMKVSDPAYDGTVIALAIDSTVVPDIKGIYEESTMLPVKPADSEDDSTEDNSGDNTQASQETENAVKEIVRIENKSLRGVSAGRIDFQVDIDGRILTIPVVVTDPKPSATYFGMYKKQKKTLRVKGLDAKYSHYKFSTSKASVATINAKGLITAKKVGHATITLVADGRTAKIKIEVSSKKGYKAARKAIAISKTKTHYSQIKRMRAHYYDCSSLISRVYRPYGVYFGVKKGWSPTAAAIGSWCTNHKKVLSYKKVSVSKLVPGDLICYSYTRNGRYRNISHIEIYAGNGQNVSASSSNNRVILYDYHKKSTVLVARPAK